MKWMVEEAVSMSKEAARSLWAFFLGIQLISALLPDCRSESRAQFELRGTLLRSDGAAFPNIRPMVQLRAPGRPVGLSAVADQQGRYRIKKVPPGMYLMTAFVPRVARAKRTIEIGPAFADEKGRITVDLKLEPRPRPPERFQVQATQLLIPDKARAEYEKGLRRIVKGDLAGSAACFAEALDLAPQYTAARYQLGLVLCQQGLFADAADHFREALKHSPESYQTLLSLGAALLAMQSNPEALEVNQRAVRARPDDPEAQAQLGISYLAADRLEDAERHLRTTIALDPANFHFPQLLLAEIYRRKRDYPSMVSQLEEFMRLHPDAQQTREVARVVGEVRSQMRKESIAVGAR
jgi:tetratricopeptide (TPR) repeat protein